MRTGGWGAAWQTRLALLALMQGHQMWPVARVKAQAILQLMTCLMTAVHQWHWWLPRYLLILQLLCLGPVYSRLPSLDPFYVLVSKLQWTSGHAVKPVAA